MMGHYTTRACNLSLPGGILKTSVIRSSGVLLETMPHLECLPTSFVRYRRRCTGLPSRGTSRETVYPHVVFRNPVAEGCRTDRCRPRRPSRWRASTSRFWCATPTRSRCSCSNASSTSTPVRSPTFLPQNGFRSQVSRSAARVLTTVDVRESTTTGCVPSLDRCARKRRPSWALPSPGVRRR